MGYAAQWHDTRQHLLASGVSTGRAYWAIDRYVGSGVLGRVSVGERFAGVFELSYIGAGDIWSNATQELVTISDLHAFVGGSYIERLNRFIEAQPYAGLGLSFRTFDDAPFAKYDHTIGGLRLGAILRVVSAGKAGFGAFLHLAYQLSASGASVGSTDGPISPLLEEGGPLLSVGASSRF